MNGFCIAPFRERIGYVISGSLLNGLVIRLFSIENIDKVKAGKFLTILSGEDSFFSLATNLELCVSNKDVLIFPPTKEERLFSDFVKERDVYVNVFIRPVIVLNNSGEMLPVKTIPSHFSDVYESSEEEIEKIFGKEDGKRYFCVGYPIDMQVPICLDLIKFTERSNGVFGKTGTGKTFITRLILAGIIKNKIATNLIFDMHSEYGYQSRQEGEGKSFVKGLKTLFPHEVVIFSLDSVSTRQRGCSSDHELIINYQDVFTDDILSLQEELSLNGTAVEAAFLIFAKYGKDWLKIILEQDLNIKDFANLIGAHPESIGALIRKIKRLKGFNFIVDVSQSKSTIEKIMYYLERGIHVILEFGRYTSVLCYLLVSNIVTRLIHKKYILKTENFIATQDKKDEPNRIMITIEEAHKFLNSVTSKQTIFGTIAREMRKYYVSLLIIDQRPSSIDIDIISQIGTKFISLLNDERDIAAVFTGVANESCLKSLLSTLDAKKQSLLLGYALSMPIAIKTRSYDERFYKDLLGEQSLSWQKDEKKQLQEIIDIIY